MTSRRLDEVIDYAEEKLKEIQVDISDNKPESDYSDDVKYVFSKYNALVNHIVDEINSVLNETNQNGGRDKSKNKSKTKSKSKTKKCRNRR